MAKTTHRHIATLHIDPVHWQRLGRIIEEGDEFRLISKDTSTDDIWIITVGCASDAVRSRMEDGWG
ncbi:hypothetical protein GXW74_27640 [Roseomonas eburnea]|uniref:Uncharacterized protein n=1 Tax=Neoroseomonas eburnea TaxID=1346889 RepID=A0A9X9XKM5_9PROT|nr:hypothetical protein [Neoroseomonas eburnea]MBR0684261.1 hypothetical protein [Neoroseomonas eburnea]